MLSLSESDFFMGLAKVGCGSEEQINPDLFGFSLALHYLCSQILRFAWCDEMGMG
jgi:hypothetical protein